MEFGFDDDEKIFVLKHKDSGSLLKILHQHGINSMYDYSAGEYLFHSRSDYHAAILMI